jgi:hypothetical protein
MPKEYSKEQLWKLYEKISPELKEAIFSEETAESIWDICSRNGIEDERISEIARYTGRVLLGILPPVDFQEILEKELKLEKSVAKKAAQEISRFIFYPVKPLLEELYKIEITPPAKPTGITPPPEEKPTAPPSKDVYRELIE